LKNELLSDKVINSMSNNNSSSNNNNSNSNNNNKERNELVKQKEMHIEEAIVQRRTMQAFIKFVAASSDPNQKLPDSIIADTLDQVETEEIKECMGKVLLMFEDFGSNFGLPLFGHEAPSVDYYNSKLSLYCFIQADVTHGTNHVIFYDERGQGKGTDALCSLRMRFHLNQLKQEKRCDVAIVVCDNCTSQNKSNAVMKFYCWLSMTLYKRVVLLFLISGHSHMHADRIVSWMKAATRGMNLFTPNEIVEECNKVKGVKSVFLDHRSQPNEFFIGFEPVLDQYILDMPSGFTKYHYFDFTNGNVTVKENCISESPECTFELCVNPSVIAKRMTQTFFGSNNIETIRMADLKLQNTPMMKLSVKKVESILKKMEMVPLESISYYPTADGDGTVEENKNEETKMKEK